MNYIFTKIKFRRDIIVLFKNSMNESEKKQQKKPLTWRTFQLDGSMCG